ncbi:MAG: decarboxylating NADP(+)-dependent phosphogluconate dehydrogenase [Deltaproteobacteria bacterium]|nr:decarboxylating NADP(+)-dependent phosphogluconate dehydrogenase [Deltaproteobacteria bacterium]
MVNKNSIGIVGLAVMGENLALNLASKGFHVAVYDRFEAVTENFIAAKAAGKPLCGYNNVVEFVGSLETPRKILLMIKAGEPVDNIIAQLMPLLASGDIVIDGGNSHYTDTQRRVELLEKNGLHFVGAGVSGGEIGALKGPSIMPGGSLAAWPALEKILMSIAAKADDGTPCCAWMGKGGAGHFVKMVHNGIEYGDMQLICETYHLMRDLLGMSANQMSSVFADWNKGDLSSYLIEITADILAYQDEDKHPLIDKILDVAGQKGTGRWTANAALDLGVPLSLISESVFARCLSSNRTLRLEAEKTLAGPQPDYQVDKTDLLKELGIALYAAKIISYAQGFALLQTASNTFNWDLNYARIAQIWRGGCIIRSAFLDKISTAYNHSNDLTSLLFDPYFKAQMATTHSSLRHVISTAVAAGIPLPSHSSGLNYYDGLRSANLPANLLQAQRDYFGAHMYERKDQPRGKWFHTNWTGEGGSTTSTTH